MSRSSGCSGAGGGFKGRNGVFGYRQARNLMNAILDRPQCKHAVILHYPPEIRDACSGSKSSRHASLNPDEVSAHIERLWANLRRRMKSGGESCRVEFVWVLEWQGKAYPHIHALLSVEVPVTDLRDCWKRAIRATRPDFAFTARTPWIGYSRKRYTAQMGAAKYLSKWEKGEKNPPTDSGFTCDRIWGASRLEGKRTYTSTAERLAPVVRDLNLLAKSRERKRGLENGSLHVTDRSGKVLYFSNAIGSNTLRRHLTRLGHGVSFGQIKVRADVKAFKVSFEKSNG